MVWPLRPRRPRPWARKTLAGIGRGGGHRRRGWLIPNTQDILDVKGQTSTTSIIKGKKYQGAIVRDPKPGAHFGVVVCDSQLERAEANVDSYLNLQENLREYKIELATFQEVDETAGRGDRSEFD